jgi:GT2 family glycosyltransferase
MRLARGRWLLLLNSDARLIDDSVARLVRDVRLEPGLGVAHCQLLSEDGQLQHTAYRFPRLGLVLLEGLGFYKLLPQRSRGELLLGGYWDEQRESDVDWVAGAFMLLPREVFETTGGFSEEIFMYGEDLEWSYRIRDAGWRIRHYPSARVVHRDHASADLRFGEEGRVTLCVLRQLEIVTARHGIVYGSAFRVANVVAALVRVVYSRFRVPFGGRLRPYYLEMGRWAQVTLRAYLSVRSR